jgi:hypothetical protein
MLPSPTADPIAASRKPERLRHCSRDKLAMIPQTFSAPSGREGQSEHTLRAGSKADRSIPFDMPECWASSGSALSVDRTVTARQADRQQQQPHGRATSNHEQRVPGGRCRVLAIEHLSLEMAAPQQRLSNRSLTRRHTGRRPYRRTRLPTPAALRETQSLFHWARRVDCCRLPPHNRPTDFV